MNSFVNYDVPAHNLGIHKKKGVFQRSKGYFNIIKCSGCNSETTCYSHSQMDVKCSGCATLLIKSTGGKAILLDEQAGCKKIENYQ